MPAHSPFGSCCSRPRFNFVGGIDDGASPRAAVQRRRVDRVPAAVVDAARAARRKVNRIVAALVAALANRGAP